jgi:hypothetical protein
MFKVVSKIVCAAVATVLLAVSANAAPVLFNASAPIIGGVTCVPSAPDGGGAANCNYQFTDQSVAFADSADVIPKFYTLFGIKPNESDIGGSDSFSFLTTLQITANSIVYNFSALATVINWNPTSAPGLNGDAALNWSQVSTPANAPLIVSFLSSGPFKITNSGLSARITIESVEAISVVPLPAGVLLLGTALLGLLGLSRRRTPALV